MTHKYGLAAACGLVLTAAAGRAAVVLPDIFAEHMVLQQGAPIAIWGSVNGPGDQVSIRFAWRTYSVTADRNGNFTTLLPPMNAGGPFELTVSDLTGDSIQFYDVHVGDVWLVSRAAPTETWNVAARSEMVLQPFVRIRDAQSPGPWVLASPNAATTYAATSYFFGRQLYHDLKVPIGLIEVTPDRLAALAPYSVRGAVWFSEGTGADALQSQIAAWRKAWGRTDLPVLCVQPGKEPIRGMAGAAAVEVDAMPNPQEVGLRIATAARAFETSVPAGK